MAQQKPDGGKPPANRLPNQRLGRSKADQPKPKPNGKTTPGAAVKASEKTPSPEPNANVERYTVKPEFWDNILDNLPPWGDEIAAIVLIVFGVVSFLSLLNVSSDATISNAWSKALTTLFGYGSVVVSGGILAMGFIILLPKLGLVVHFPTLRILALELAFLSFLAILHLSTGDPELRAVARAGHGGGYVGWGLSIIIAGLFGSSFALMVYGILLVIGLAIVAGVRRAHLATVFQQSQRRLTDFATQITPPERKPPVPEVIIPKTLVQTGPLSPRSPANSLMRIRPNPANLPPSLRSIAAPPSPVTKPITPPPAAVLSAPANPIISPVPPVPSALPVPPSPPPPSPPPTVATSPTSTAVPEVVPPLEAPPSSPPPPPPINASEHPLFNRRENPVSPAAIGTILEVKGKHTGPRQVERPDGRLKRYFTVDSMKEAKYSPKRDANLPPLDILRDLEITLPTEQEINTNVVLIENTLLEFDIDVDVVDVKVGPTVTQYAVQPFREVTRSDGETNVQRTRVNKIVSLADDLALTLAAKRLRLESPVPGQSYIGIEVPNKNPSTVALRSVYESHQFHEEEQKSKSPLLVPLGRDVSGAPLSIDLAGMPHLLIAGTTGSGKSVCIAGIASALVLNNLPTTIKLIMLDPKMVELSRFNGLPHLLGPVETDLERILGVLRWCTREMDRRYRILEENAARNIDTYNSRLGRRRKDDYMPYIVILVDEIGDLMMSRPEETEKTITRLAQMARAVGMHLVVATQRPSVDVITGLIKANFPARISFAVASGVDSRVILDTVGAEMLLGKGDMLYQSPEAAAPRRLQGCFVSDDEVRGVVDWWKKWQEEQVKAGNAEAINIGPWERGLTRREFLSETDPMLEQAIALVVAEGEASAALIQRRLGVGYPRAARIMDLLEELGIVGEPKGGGRGRIVLIQPGKDPFKELIERRMKGQQKSP